MSARPAEPGSVALAAGIAAAIHQQAAAAGPRECCGLLEGQRDGDRWRITALHPARNLATGADRFEIDPADHFAAVRVARARGMRIIGCYHSHPGGEAQPSAHDLAGAGQDDFLWLIAANGALAVFLFRGGVFGTLATGADWVTSSG